MGEATSVKYPTTKTHGFPKLGASRKETLVPAQPSNLRSPEWDATPYHRLSDPQFSWGNKVLKRLKLRGDELVLDAGCGIGRLTAELLERLPKGRVIAVDHSENMLRAASESLGPRFGDRVTFVRADLQTLRIEKRRWTASLARLPSTG
jgi:trans-aconitate 2-methyltransferase